VCGREEGERSIEGDKIDMVKQSITSSIKRLVVNISNAMFITKVSASWSSSQCWVLTVNNYCLPIQPSPIDLVDRSKQRFLRRSH
jgi:hypothetical protein